MMEILWSPYLDPWVFTVVAAAASASVWFAYTGLRVKFGRLRAGLATAPRALTATIVLILILNPGIILKEPKGGGAALVLVDVSPSMSTPAGGGATRASKAAAAAERVMKSLPTGIEARIRHFDSGLLPPGKPGKLSTAGNTDIPSTLSTALDEGLPANAAAVILITDGGDERFELTTQLPCPLDVVCASGADDAFDIRVDDVRRPLRTDEQAEFEVAAVIGSDGAAPKGLVNVEVLLERLSGSAWTLVDKAVVPLSGGAVAPFKHRGAAAGNELRLRVRVEPAPGELSILNNCSEFSVPVDKGKLRVLYFAESIDANYKFIRGQLAKSPGFEFVGLLRSMGDAYSLQSDTPGLDLGGARGFPSDLAVLRRFDCVMIGPFPMSKWTSEQADALSKYVEGGGATVFFGGEDAFFASQNPSDAQYQQQILQTPTRSSQSIMLSEPGAALARLLPFATAPNGIPFTRGTFQARVSSGAVEAKPTSALAAQERVIGGLPPLPGVNADTILKPGAEPILDLLLPGRTAPLAAIQRYGSGKVMALATDSLWRWAGASPELRDACGKFLRQSIISIVGRERGEGVSIEFDREVHRPGQSAAFTLEVFGSDKPDDCRPTVTAQVEGAVSATSILLRPAGVGRHRGSARIDSAAPVLIQARVSTPDGRQLSCDRRITPEPSAREGSRIRPDKSFLKKLAVDTGGVFVESEDTAPLEEAIAKRIRSAMVERRIGLGDSTPAAAIILILLLCVEWAARRSMGAL